MISQDVFHLRSSLLEDQAETTQKQNCDTWKAFLSKSLGLEHGHPKRNPGDAPRCFAPGGSLDCGAVQHEMPGISSLGHENHSVPKLEQACPKASRWKRSPTHALALS